MKTKMFLAAGLLVSTMRLHASPINIPDFSFEGITASINSPTNFLGAGVVGTNSGPIGLWTAFAGASVIGLNSSVASGTTNALGAPAGADGSYVARITLPAGVGAADGIEQILTNTYLANSIYTLSFQLDGGTAVNLLAGSSLSLESGSTPVATLSGANLVTLLDGNGDFQTISLTYQTGNSPPLGNIGIEFDANSVGGVGGSIYFDNFQLDASPVPEPQTLALIAMGSLLMFGFSKSRKAS